MDRVKLVIHLMIIAIIALLIVISCKIKTSNELLNDYNELVHQRDSLSNQIFELQRERTLGLIMYNTSIVKPSLTIKESNTLDSLVLVLTDSTDIVRICNKYKLENTVWQK